MENVEMSQAIRKAITDIRQIKNTLERHDIRVMLADTDEEAEALSTERDRAVNAIKEKREALKEILRSNLVFSQPQRHCEKWRCDQKDSTWKCAKDVNWVCAPDHEHIPDSVKEGNYDLEFTRKSSAIASGFGFGCDKEEALNVYMSLVWGE